MEVFFNWSHLSSVVVMQVSYFLEVFKNRCQSLSLHPRFLWLVKILPLFFNTLYKSFHHPLLEVTSCHFHSTEHRYHHPLTGV